jgi:hypothetical protein
MTELDELFRRAIEDRLLDLHTSFLGKFTKVNLDGTADVQPLTRRPVPATDGGFQYEQIPTVPKALVLAFGTPRSFLGPTVQSGDLCWCLCPESDISGALASGSEVDPSQVSRHGLACPLAIPLCLAGTATSADFAAMASKVDTALSNISTWLTTHTHPTAAVGPPSVSALPSPTLAPTASAGMKLK